MTPTTYETDTEAMHPLNKRCYTIHAPVLHDEDCLVSNATAASLSPADFEIDHFYRVEGHSDPGDQMIVYAISSKKDNIKGIVVNGYGMYANNESSANVKKLNAHPKH